MKIYAQLNENQICVGISQLSGEVNADNMVEIESFNESYLWKKYKNGEWSAEKYEPVSTAPIDEFEALKAKSAELEQDNLALKLALTESQGTHIQESLELKLAIAELAEGVI